MKTSASIVGFALLTFFAANGHAQYTLKRDPTPLANYQPEGVTEIQTGTTSSVFKTYEDDRNKGSRVSIDLSQGFLYRNPASGKLEAVLNEGRVSLDVRGYVNDNGLPASQIAIFREVPNDTTNSRFKLYNTKDTGQSGVPLDSSTGRMWENPVTDKWEAVLREPNTAYVDPNSGSDARGSNPSNGSGPTLGQKIAEGVAGQLGQSITNTQNIIQRRGTQGPVIDVGPSNRPAPVVTRPVAAPTPIQPVYNPPTSYGHSSDDYGGHGH